MDCIDLRPWARARRYRFRLEDSYKAEKNPAVRGDGRWYVEIVCKRGLIYPWGEDDLLAFTKTRGVLPTLLAVDPAVRFHQRGKKETVVRFPSRLLDAVATVLRPRRRRTRTLTPEQAAQLAARGRRALAQHRAATSQVPETNPESTHGQADGSTPGPGAA